MKVYEAMAAELPMVSTQVGMEGLACVPGRDILVGDSPEEFARHCMTLLENPELGRTIAASALRLVEEECSWEAVSKQFEDVLVRVSRNGE
jgi:glycosyltransferase involved in cell wall biosynthesis